MFKIVVIKNLKFLFYFLILNYFLCMFELFWCIDIKKNIFF